MKSRIYTLLSALSASLAAVLFLMYTKIGTDQISWWNFIIYTCFAVVLWAPSNAFFALALKYGNPSSIYMFFGIGAALMDTVLGILILKQVPNNPLLLIIGIAIGLFVVFYSGLWKDEGSMLKADNHHSEIILYVLTAFLILIGYISTNVWVQLAAYCVSDFLGAVLIVKILGKLKKLNQFMQDWTSGMLGLAPVMLAGVILLSNVKILPIVGPMTGIATASFAIPGTVIFFRNKINVSRTLLLLVGGIAAIWLIYSAY